MDPIPGWATPLLQGLAFWVAYSRTVAPDHYPGEGALVTEAAKLIRSKLGHGYFTEAEVLYRDIPEVAKADVVRGTRNRSDLVVTNDRRADRKSAYGTGVVEAILEVKHRDSAAGAVDEDLDYLGALPVGRSESPRRFVVYVSPEERPPAFTDEIGKARPGVLTTPRGTRYRVRRVCRALWLVPGDAMIDQGTYVVLLELGDETGEG